MKINPTRIVIHILTLLFIVSASLSTALAVEGKKALAESAKETAQTAIPGSESSNQKIDELDKALESITQQKRVISDLQKRIGKTEGLIKQALEVRLNNARMKLLEQGLAYANAVLAQREAGEKVENYHKKAVELLTSQADVAKVTA